MQMRTRLISVVMSALFVMPVAAQNVNTDSIKAEMDKIEITNQGMKQVIENYKKGVIKGDLESMNLLGMECMTGQYVKSNPEMGLNLLDAAAKQNYVEAQYNLSSYYYMFWLSQPKTTAYFTTASKWLKKAVKAGDNRSIILLARFYNDYGVYKNDPSYVEGGINILEGYPKIDEVNNKDENVLNAQACLGTICLGKWRMDNDTTALCGAKKWYQTLLKSDLQFPNYSQYIDSLQKVLNMGVPTRIDPMPTAQQIEESKKPATGGRGGFPGGGFPGGGAPGGFPGGAPGGAQGGAPQGPAAPTATFLGGQGQMQQFIRSNTLYPENLKTQKINGQVSVEFTVDTDGSIQNPHVVREGQVPFMNQEALRVVMIMPDFIPATQEDGTPVKATQTVNVSFGAGGRGGMGGFGF